MTQQAIARTNEVLDTSTKKSAANWHNLLRLQTKMFLPYELSYLFDCESWGKAKNVLDVGCGDGSYIKRIAAFFPKKKFSGIDISAELISIASSDPGNEKITFKHADLYDLTEDEERYDVIIMRLIVQHLGDFKGVLSQASKLLSPGGSLIIIEPDLESSWNLPETPKFDALLRSFDVHNTRMHTNRAHLSHLDLIANDVEDWLTQQVKVMTAPFTGVTPDSDIVRLYSNWIDILEDSQVVAASIDDVRSELEQWSSRDDAYAQIGIRILHLGYKKPLFV